ncbi:MAG TPA: SCO6880 family protein [Sporichthyaceae bacterium]|nr:SCO6880 family protein [Sporichthyaceae bacterium]
MTNPEIRYYSGWQRERAGFLFSLSGAQVTLAVLALFCLAAPVLAHTLVVAAVTWPLGAVLAGLTWARIAGRTPTEWTRLAVGFGLNRQHGRDVFLSGAFAPRDPANPTAPAPMDLPGPLAVLRFLEAETAGLLTGGPRIAVVHHPLDDTYTAVARIRFPGIALADHTKREARIGGWGSLLAQLCNEGSPFTRIATVHRTVPDDGAALIDWHRTSVRPDAPAAAVQAVEELLARATLVASQQETWLVLTMDAGQARTQIRTAGGGDVGALAFLVRQLVGTSSAIGAAHLEIERWLGVRELAEVVRVAFDPSSASPLAAGRHPGTPGALLAGVDPRLAGPAAAVSRWDHYKHDSGFSVTYEVSDWPRAGVPAWFLRPVLNAQQSARRSFALVLEPLSPRRAEKVVMQARTKRTVTVRMRHKTGQLVPEHEMQALNDAELMDRHRADGHGLVRFVGYLTVTVTDLATLPLACSELETDAGQCGLTLRRLWGAQDVGFYAAALPLGMGLPKARGWA